MDFSPYAFTIPRTDSFAGSFVAVGWRKHNSPSNFNDYINNKIRRLRQQLSADKLAESDNFEIDRDFRF